MATRRPTFKTGTPAITTPRPVPQTGQLDQRGVQQAIDAIKERFANAEAQLLFLASVADAATSGQAIALLQQQMAALLQQINVLAAQLTGVSSDPGDDIAAQAMTAALLAEQMKNAHDQEPVTNTDARLSELEKRVKSLEEII